jgi:hypothetical protein
MSPVSGVAAVGPIMADQKRKTSPVAAFPRTAQAARTGPFPPTIEQARKRMQLVALKWRDLAERRRAHFIDLYESGRWKHYYTDYEFLEELRQAIAIAQKWARIAPRPGEGAQAVAEVGRLAPLEAPRPKAAA